MNYENQKLIDMLAAEYVLGTLVGLARDRYSRLMLTSTRAREATWKWEQHLNRLASSIESVTPDQQVWERISQRIDSNVVALNIQAQASNDEGNTVKETPKKQKSRFLQVWSMAASVACIALAAVIWQSEKPLPVDTFESSQLAVFKNEAKAPLWLVDVQDQNLMVKASSSLEARADKDYELWMILKGQDAPISLGLLPKDGVKILVRNSRFKAEDIALLAVSLEPLGGSPTGSPTEVLYTTDLVVL